MRISNHDLEDLRHAKRLLENPGLAAKFSNLFGTSIDHFQDIARGHFIVRRLERVYGMEVVRQEYDRLMV